LIADIEDMEKVGMDIPQTAYKLAVRFWPGPLTCIIPKQPTLPETVSATSTVGVRVPDHEAARALLRAAGPMAVTSANISGAQSPSTAEEVFAQLDGRIPLIIDGGRTQGGVPSTVVDCTTDELKILREGPISLHELLSALQ
jgi:L-threonylcarbamoyladenylate synthase